MMHGLSKYDAMKLRLHAIELLRLLKRNLSYRELSQITGISESVLCRYVKGQTVPSLEHAVRIVRSIRERFSISGLLASRIKSLNDGYIDISGITSDPVLLKLAAHYAVAKLAGRRITKILTPEANGIPFATLIASLLEVPLVVARRSKESPYEDYIEAIVAEPSLRATITYYVPRRLIGRRDSVLIVDDLVQSGRTIKALATSIARVGAQVAGVVALVAVGEQRSSVPQPFIPLLRLTKHHMIP